MGGEPGPALSTTQRARKLSREVLRFYSLREQPFALNPNPRYFYPSNQHRESVSKAQYFLENQGGLVVVMGDVGMGKTLLCRYMADSYLDDATYRIAVIYNPHFSTRLQFLQAVCREFGVGLVRNEFQQLALLEEFLRQEYKSGRSTILFVDEANLLRGPHFELIRQLLNYEASETKLIQLVLFGQTTQLVTKLQTKRALLSRVATQSVLAPFELDELTNMIDHRLRVAGRVDPLFTDQALVALYNRSRGVPREAIEICLNALPLGAINKRERIDEDIITQAAAHKTLRDTESAP